MFEKIMFHKDGCCGGDCGCNHNEEVEKNDCSCGCGEEQHDHQNTITLTLDDGTKETFNVLTIFDFEEKEYIALLKDEGQDVYLYEFKELEEDEVELTNIESDEEYDRVGAYFMNEIVSEDEEA